MFKLYKSYYFVNRKADSRIPKSRMIIGVCKNLVIIFANVCSTLLACDICGDRMEWSDYDRVAERKCLIL